MLHGPMKFKLVSLYSFQNNPILMLQNECRHVNSFSYKLYLVHIRALVLLYQITTNKCTHMLLNHNFINTIQDKTHIYN